MGQQTSQTLVSSNLAGISFNSGKYYRRPSFKKIGQNVCQDMPEPIQHRLLRSRPMLESRITVSIQREASTTGSQTKIYAKSAVDYPTVVTRCDFYKIGNRAYQKITITYDIFEYDFTKSRKDTANTTIEYKVIYKKAFYEGYRRMKNSITNSI